MRTIRALTIAAAVVAAIPTISFAQSGRQFHDAWFWGVKAGGLTVADSGQAYTQAPLAGIEWLITRKHGGVYVSAAQAFITSQAFIFRDPAQPDSGERIVDLKNLRRVDVAIMGFPGEHLRFHPYAGIGMAMTQVADAQPQAPFGTSDQYTYAQQVIQENKVAFSPLLMAGAQYQMSRFSVFGQGSISPAQEKFLMYHGRPWNFTYEVGLRYNVGSSIEKN